MASAGRGCAEKADMSKPRLMAATALLILVALACGAIWHLSRTAAYNGALVDHTHRVQELSKDVLGRLIDAETGQRGYLLTGREGYLQPFNEASPRITATILQLRSRTADNPGQQSRLDRLSRLAGRVAELVEIGVAASPAR
jgi:CHASE3 domain sensor protein